MQTKTTTKASKQQQKHRSLAVTAERSYEYRRLATQARSISLGGGVGQDSGSRIGGSGNKPIPSVPRREQSYGYEVSRGKEGRKEWMR